MIERFLYVVLVVKEPEPDGAMAAPGIMAFASPPDGHDIHAHVLRDVPSAKTVAAALMRMWEGIPPDLMASLEDDARKGVRSGIARMSGDVRSWLYVMKNPQYPEADRAAQSPAAN